VEKRAFVYFSQCYHHQTSGGPNEKVDPYSDIVFLSLLSFLVSRGKMETLLKNKIKTDGTPNAN
jgi:hypothetical protein